MTMGLTKAAGARIVITSPDGFIPCEEEGMDIHPSTLTQVGIQSTVVTRQPFPYTSECYSDWNSTDYGELMGQMRQQFPYSIAVSPLIVFSNDHECVHYKLKPFKQLCRRVCILRQVVQECSCFHPLYADFQSMTDGKEPCNLSQEGKSTGNLVQIHEFWCVKTHIFFLYQKILTVLMPWLIRSTMEGPFATAIWSVRKTFLHTQLQPPSGLQITTW